MNLNFFSELTPHYGLQNKGWFAYIPPRLLWDSPRHCLSWTFPVHQEEGKDKPSSCMAAAQEVKVNFL